MFKIAKLLNSKIVKKAVMVVQSKIKKVQTLVIKRKKTLVKAFQINASRVVKNLKASHAEFISASRESLKQTHLTLRSKRVQGDGEKRLLPPSLKASVRQGRRYAPRNDAFIPFTAFRVTVQRLLNKITNSPALAVLLLSTLVSIASLVYFYNQNLVLAYGDAESHLNISKRVISGATPGMGQLGGIWLPIHHLLMVPFVINDGLWRSGLGGCVVSMISFVASALLIFKIVELVTKKRLAAWVATLAFMVNPGVLYMQSVPMGELPEIALFLGCVYFLARWAIQDKFINLIFSAFFVFCASLIRYDAWFMIGYAFLCIPFIGLYKRMHNKKIEGLVILFSTVAFFGVLLWLIWNYMIFGDPLYFISSPYSARSQQQGFLQRGELLSHHNLGYSLALYVVTAAKTSGVIFSALGLLGLVGSLIVFRKKLASLAALSILLTPLPFYVLTLFLGISIILLPEMVPADFDFKMFNVRYGMMMIPAVVIFIGLLFSFLNRFNRALCGLLIVVQLGMFAFDGRPIVLEDAITGLSSRRPTPANDFIREHYDYGYVMFDDFSRSANPISMGVPMQKIIYVGNHPYWEESLVNPTKHIRWFIVREENNDALWTTLKDNPEFKANYQAIHNNGTTVVYRRYDHSLSNSQ